MIKEASQLQAYPANGMSCLQGTNGQAHIILKADMASWPSVSQAEDKKAERI